MKCINCKFGCPTKGDLYCFFTNRTRIENVLDQILKGTSDEAECDLNNEELGRAWEYSALQRTE